MDYQNYQGVCFGGEYDNSERPIVKCCDASRGNAHLTINPTDRRQMKAIAYDKSGRVYVREDAGLDTELVQAMQEDIDKVLCLNGALDDDKKMIYDTASRLRANRKSVYDSVCSQFSRWGNQRKNKLTSAFLAEKIEQMEKQLDML